MKDPSGTNAELIAEITALNHKIQELEKSESDRKRAEQEMAIIAEIGRLIGSTLNIDEVYERFAAEARKLISFDRIHVNLKNPYGETFTIAYVSGADIAGRRPGDKVPLAGSITEVLFRTRVGLLFHPASAEEILGRFPGASAATTFRAGMNSIMAVPLISRDEAIGALHFRAKKANAFTERDIRLAERIGMQIAGAIANAQLYSGLRETEKSLQESTVELLATNEKLSREIAEREKAEEALLVSHNELESLVAQRTATLEETNRRLLAEIEARKKSDDARQEKEVALRQTEENFHRSLDESPLGVRIVTVDGDTLYANRAILDIYGYDSVDELRATPVKKRYTPESYAEFKTRFDKRLRGENVPPEYEISIIRKDGEVRRLQAFRRPVLWDGKEQFQVLYQDVTDRRRMEETLRKREEELAAESRQLAETNTALWVVLQRQEEDIREMENKIVANVKKLVLPYLGELRKRHPTPAQLNYLDVIESNLQQIISPFLQNLAARFADFTPRELQIANLIKDGKSGKEIADIIMISTSSVDFHRNNIRKKLGLAHKANSLRSSLLTLTE